MAYKVRTEPPEMLRFEILSNRMELTEQEKQFYTNLKKGYEGEVIFDQLTENLDSDCLILNDLLLEINNAFFQIDTLIIFSDTIHVYEIKNYEGDYYYESGKLYKKPKYEINNPLNQLNRIETLLRQLLYTIRMEFPIDASVVFINPEFTLYQAPLNKPFIFPSQVKRHLQQFINTPSKLTTKHKYLADKLISLHMIESPYKNLPSYEYNQLKRGMTCGVCKSFSVVVKGLKLIVCQDCKSEVLFADAIMRAVNEFKLLFSNEIITTNIIHDWCNAISSKTRIKRVLEKNLLHVSNTRWSYYESNHT